MNSREGKNKGKEIWNKGKRGEIKGWKAGKK